MHRGFLLQGMQQGYARMARGCSGRGRSRHNRLMDPRAEAILLDSDLPVVRHGLPWPLRLLFVAFGVFALVMPAWELGRGLWPISIATPVFAIIIVGAASVGIAMIRAGLAFDTQVWSFPPGVVLIRHRGWRSERELRLTAHNIAAIEARRIEAMEGDDYWRVVIVPKPTESGLRMASRNGAFETGDFTTATRADAVRRALLEHLGMR